MKIQLRPAQRGDCPRLLELVRELARFERAPEEVTVTIEHFTETGFGPAPLWWAWVAAGSPDSGPKEEILGFALYYVRYSTWKGSAMYLEDILVTETMRGQGIGKLLFERLIQEAREKKFKRIVWQVLDWNESAIGFYKKYGASFDPAWVNCSLEI
jgi:GNAT superfamily N-acetyltransferase